MNTNKLMAQWAILTHKKRGLAFKEPLFQRSVSQHQGMVTLGGWNGQILTWCFMMSFKSIYFIVGKYPQIISQERRDQRKEQFKKDLISLFLMYEKQHRKWKHRKWPQRGLQNWESNYGNFGSCVVWKIQILELLVEVCPESTWGELVNFRSAEWLLLWGDSNLFK